MLIWLNGLLASLLRHAPQGRNVACRITQGQLALHLNLTLEHLEPRETPSAGGGFTNGGLVGQYYNNTTLSGTPSFTRDDVRLDFTWTAPPGGSIAQGYRDIGTTN